MRKPIIILFLTVITSGAVFAQDNLSIEVQEGFYQLPITPIIISPDQTSVLTAKNGTITLFNPAVVINGKTYTVGNTRDKSAERGLCALTEKELVSSDSDPGSFTEDNVTLTVDGGVARFRSYTDPILFVTCK